MEDRKPSLVEMLSATGNAVLAKRSKNLAEVVQMNQEQLCNTYKMEVIKLQNELDSYTDLSVKSKDSLSLVNAGFDPAEFVQTIQLAKQKLREAKVRHMLSVQTYNEWFPENPREMPTID